MIKELKKIIFNIWFNKNKSLVDFNNTSKINYSSLIESTDKSEEVLHQHLEFVWCLVGNIVAKHNYGQNKEVRFGSKHFSPNTKVYCFPISWGDWYQQIRVIGKHRKSGRRIILVMRSDYVTKWRLKKVYDPEIIKIMKNNNGWSSTENDKERILQMLKWLPQRFVNDTN